MCRTRGQSACLLVERGTQALWRHGSGFACCTFMQVSARVRISALSRIRIEAQRSGQCGIDVSSITPTPIGAIRRLRRANLFGKCCVEGRARSSHISVLSSISVGLSPYIGEQPCAKVKERAGTDLPLRRTAMLFRCRFSFPNSISISKQQCQVNAKVFESGEPYCSAPPSIALCLENWARRDTFF